MMKRSINKKHWLTWCLSGVCVCVIGTLVPSLVAQEQREMLPPEKLSYTLGYVVSHAMEKHRLPIDVEMFAEGFMDARNQDKLLLSVEDMREIMEKLRLLLEQRRQAQADAQQQDAEHATARVPAPSQHHPGADQMSSSAEQNPVGLRFDSRVPWQERIDPIVPSGRVDTAVPETARRTAEVDAYLAD